MPIIKVPSVFMIKLPGGEWLNLTEVRRIEVEPPGQYPYATVAVYWTNRSKQIYHDEKALAILEALAESEFIDKSHVTLSDLDH